MTRATLAEIPADSCCRDSVYPGFGKDTTRPIQLPKTSGTWASYGRKQQMLFIMNSSMRLLQRQQPH
jgi:hypothetical protein